MTAHRVDFVDEDNGRRGLLGLIEQVTDAAGAHADEHFHKVGTGNGEEGRIGLACHGLGQQGLTGARRAHQQHALGNARAHGGIGLGVLQEIDHLLKFFLFFLGPGHILEGDLVLGRVADPGAAAAEVHHLAVAAALTHHDEIPQTHDQNQTEEVGQVFQIPRRDHRRAVFHREGQIADADVLQRLAGLGGSHLAHGLDEVRADSGFKIIAPIRKIRVGHLAVAVQAHQRRAADGDGLHVILPDGGQQLGVFDPFVLLLAQPAVEQDCDHEKDRDQDHVPHQSPLVLLQSKSPP